MTKQWMGGKGSTQRKVDKQKFSDNWDKIFNKEKADGNESSATSSKENKEETSKKR